MRYLASILSLTLSQAGNVDSSFAGTVSLIGEPFFETEITFTNPLADIISPTDTECSLTLSLTHSLSQQQPTFAPVMIIGVVPPPIILRSYTNNHQL